MLPRLRKSQRAANAALRLAEQHPALQFNGAGLSGLPEDAFGWKSSMNGEVADLVLRAYNEPMDQINAENNNQAAN